jgi:parallel beta-helix repeat protein
MKGGVVIDADQKSIVIIAKTKFYGNDGAHIEITGLKNKCLIEDNFFQGDSRGFGINIGIGSRPRIFNNEIRDMMTGINIVSADAIIIKNKISGCFNGLTSKTYDGYINETRIKLNTIEENLENGIVVTGKNNSTTVIQNVNISKNKKAGIRVEKEAHAKISQNRIFNNANQGILLVENSYAFIEENAIFHNIKANIALGGSLSENTVIIGNKIYNSSSEGIFVMLAGPCMIYNNQIYSNYDGIVVLEGVPEISFNQVYKNKNNGIHVLRGSMITMRSNKVFANEGIGLVLREKSLGIIEKNEIKDNELELAVEYEVDGI